MAGRSGSVRVRMESIDYLQRFTWMDQTIGLGKFSSSELELVSAPAFFLARSSGRAGHVVLSSCPGLFYPSS